ncbi:cell division protein ZipA [Vibrio litoralis]|uniref:cell division protein ZipA n=1 Tax=Vibrio litoralis TaxID=335972 RepID=UPI00041DDE99|nr:cell division protein ZipA [Vibrio litoralis]
MQELRLVLIIVGGLAIAGLLVHGIWTSKKEGKAKFADKPLNKMEPKVNTPLADDAQEGIVSHATPVKERKEPAFHIDESEEDIDPLFGESDISFAATDDVAPDQAVKVEVQDQTVKTQAPFSEPEQVTANENITDPEVKQDKTESTATGSQSKESQENEQTDKNDMEVIIFHVHAAGSSEFVGTQLFNSMQQHGLHYGAMDIFHCHTDTSGTGKVLFSVANMMNPGTLAHDDPATFITKGISFFMTLPCYGDAEQNFKLMLKTAQQIADDLGANVLDDKRNLMTPNRLSAYRQQIRDYVARSTEAE